MKKYMRFGFAGMLLCAGGIAWAADGNRGGGSGAGVEADTSPGWLVPYTGIDAGQDTYFTYGGLVLAPDKDMTDPGVLVNVFGGYGRFQYSSIDDADGMAKGSVSMVDALVGYQMHANRFRFASFIGIESMDVTLSPADRAVETQGRDTGGKIVFDAETNNSIRPYLSATASYSTSFDSWSVALRPGYRTDAYVFGAEFTAQGNNASDFHRVGLFSKYSQLAGKWGSLAISASGGWGYVEEDNSNFVGGSRNGPYGALGFSLFF